VRYSVALLVVPSIAFAAAQNLVPNGGFEEGALAAAPGKAPPPGWVATWGHPAYHLVPEHRPGSTGKQCFSLHTTGEVPLGGVKSAFAPIDPARPVRVHGYFSDRGSMETNAGPRIALLWFDKDREPVNPPGRRGNLVYLDRRKLPGWQCFSRVFVPAAEAGPQRGHYAIPAAAAFCQVWFFATHYTGPTWFDDVEIAQEPVEAPAPRLQLTDATTAAEVSEFDWVVNWLGPLEGEYKATVRFAADKLAGALARVRG
jgi:hypothetical protein